MHENTDPARSPDAIRQAMSKNTATVAQREMEYVMWKFGDDIHDIGDGLSPVGERLSSVVGLPTTLEMAKQLMRQDPTIRFMHLVPKQPGIWCKTVRIARRVVRGSSREALDPNAGLDEYKRD